MELAAEAPQGREHASAPSLCSEPLAPRKAGRVPVRYVRR